MARRCEKCSSKRIKRGPAITAGPHGEKTVDCECLDCGRTWKEEKVK